jgi:hypothetical protein
MTWSHRIATTPGKSMWWALKAKGTTGRTSISSGARRAAASHSRVTMKLSVLRGRWNPCCSVAPIGWITTGLRAATARSSSQVKFPQ